MLPEYALRFGPYRLDASNERLRRGNQVVRLTGKAFAVLCYLLGRPGQLVTREELFRAVWPETVVSDAALTTCIKEIRKALKDQTKTPQYIETVHRRGFRFIARLAPASPPAQSPRSKVQNLQSQPASSPQHPTLSFVGREEELARLQGWFGRALAGERQFVFITGEPGIGKTVVIEMFLNQIVTKEQLRVGRGQCVEQYGAGEAYLPVLEALGRLCRELHGQHLIQLLDQYAPTWLIQMPTLLSANELNALHRKTAGMTQQRMFREMAETLEAFTAEHPLILVLEDLHWSDYSTLELLAFLARRREAARLLVMSTYRPVEVLTHEHPLKGVKQELSLHGQCEELPLDFLTEAAVEEYLTARFDFGVQHAEPRRNLARLIHQHTDGNPLFMVNVTNHFVNQEVITTVAGEWKLKDRLEEVEVGVPESLRQLIEQQIGQVRAEERAVLEAASVAGVEFPAAAVATGIGMEEEAVEEVCEALVRRGQLLRSTGTTEWPDGILSARYGFIHTLYREVLYKRVPLRRRMSLHQRIGEQLERAYGDRVGEVAAELAVHFERGRDFPRATRYLQQAAETALRRSAYREATSLLTQELRLCKALPRTREHAQQEISVLVTLGRSLMATKGYAASEVGEAYTRAFLLCQEVGETLLAFPVLFGLWQFSVLRAEFQTARKLGEQLLSLALSQHDATLLLEVHRALGYTLLSLGEFIPAQEHCTQGIALYDPQQHRSRAFLYGQDPGITCLVYAAQALWLLGYPAQALQRSQEASALSEELSHPYSRAVALGWAAWLHQHRRAVQLVQESAERLILLSVEQGFSLWRAQGTIMQGWAFAMQGQEAVGIAQIQRGLAAIQTTGTVLMRPYFLALLAEAHQKAGQIEEAFTILTDALETAYRTGEGWYEAALLRLKGTLTLQKFQVSSSRCQVASTQCPAPNTQAEVEAEAYFLKAIEVARRQQAKSLELRAVMSLARLWQSQGKTVEARRILAEIYDWFTEGFDTVDLREAQALLAVL